MNVVRHQDLNDTTLYQRLKPNFYLSKKAHYLKGNYIYEDFILKVEEVEISDLVTARKNISKKINLSELNTIFFQLDSSTLSSYPIQDLNHL